MAKAKALTASLLILALQPQSIVGEVLSRNASGILVRNKKPRSSKFQDTFIPTADVIAIYTTEETTVWFRSTAATELDTVTGTVPELNEFGFLQVETEAGTVEVSPASASVSSVDSDADAAPAAAPAKSKKAAAEPEEEAPAAKKGAGKKAAAEPEPEPEPAEDEFEPEVGGFVIIDYTDEDGDAAKMKNVEVIKLTTKSITVQDKAEEDHVFKLADVTVTEGVAPKAKAGAKKAEAEEEAPAPKKGAGKKAADAEEEAPPAKKGAAGKKAADADGDW